MTINEATRRSDSPCPGDSATATQWERCERCGDTVLEVELLMDGDAFTMRSCTACDRRSWRRAGHDIDFDGVRADMTTAVTRYRHRLATRFEDERQPCSAPTD